MPTLARCAAVAALALSLAAQALHLQQKEDPQPKLAQADGELETIGFEEAEWPGRARRNRKQAKEVATQAAKKTGRMAVLVSGSVERLLLTPLLNNVVRANAQKGLQVDLFLNLKAPTRLGKVAVLKHQDANDPKIASLLQGIDDFSFNSTVMDFICDLAKTQLASDCHWDLEGDDAVSLPPDTVHHNIMTENNPITTATGKAVVARWRSLSRLWTMARKQEAGDEYSAVLIAHEDDYFLAPRLVDIESFQMDSLQLSAIPCMDSTGINEKAAVMGREAADTMLRLYQAWQKGDMKMEGTRTASEVWFRYATESGLNVKPEPMNMAQATYTHSGLPCFQESTFNLKEGESYEQCFTESPDDAPISSLFGTFSCDTMNPDFYDLLWPQQVQRLQQVISTIAHASERTPIVLTVVNHGETEAALSMLTSLEAAGEEASSLIIGTSSGICKALSESLGVPGSKCLVVQPAQDVRSSIFKHAILTTVAAAGLTDRIVYASPHATFPRALASSSKRMLFSRSLSQAREAKACSEASGDLSQIDNSVIYLSDAPEVTEVLLRAWSEMLADEKITQTEALATAVQATGYADFAFLPCGSHSVQSTNSTADADKVLSWEMPPGVAKTMRRKQRKASENAWVDRFRKQTSSSSTRRERPASQQVDDPERRAAWQKQQQAWKDTWAQRVQELQEENGYNETAAREERRQRRAYNRAHKDQTHKKHVRYLPPEEAAKVKAKEEKWEAQQEKQRMEDLEKAESRKEAFQREVEKAQRIMENEDAKDSESTGSADEEAGAA